jgi:hypothetical protein
MRNASVRALDFYKIETRKRGGRRETNYAHSFFDFAILLAFPG